MKMEELRDIEDFVTISDQSILYFLLSISAIIIIIILIIVIYFWLKKPKKIYKQTLKDKAKIELENINFDNTKEMIYIFSENIQIIVKNDEDINKFLLKLNKYKFRKHIPDLDDKDLDFIKKMIDKVKDDRYYK